MSKTPKQGPQGEEGDDLTLLEQLMSADNDDNVFLFDENGESVELEQIAVIPHEGQVYALLRPLDADEDSAAVFRIVPEDEESVESVEDEELAMTILNLYNDQVDKQ